MKQLVTAAVTAMLLASGAATAVNIETLPKKEQEQFVNTPRALKTGEPTAASKSAAARGGPAKGPAAPAPRVNVDTKKQPPKKGDKPS